MKKKLKLLGLLLLTNILVYSQSTPIVYIFEDMQSIQSSNNEIKDYDIPTTLVFHNNNLDMQFNEDTLSFVIFEDSYELSGDKEELSFDMLNKRTRLVNKAYLSPNYFIVEELNKIFIFYTK